MAKQYYSVITDYGTQVIASAIASKQPLQITQMAVGDGNGRATTPNSRNTSLVREVHRTNISAISIDPRNNKQIIFELTIPENVGGFWIREMGIFDNQNRLVAYANCPDSFKPQLESGSGKVQVVRMILLVSSSDAITLKVDDSVIFVTRGQLTPKKITATTKNAVDETGHSHEIDKASTAQAGIVQLTNDTNSDSETLGLTAKAGKTLKALIDALTRNLANYIPNSKKSNAINSASGDTVATSKAVYGLNNIKLDKVGGEAFLKTIDHTKADGYTYSGFYRPNSSKLNNLALSSLMMHITHPAYTTNAHARGIGFSYGSYNGNQAWDLFTTAFDANGAYLGQKQIMTELGGQFNGDVTLNTKNSLYVRRLRSTNNNSDWLDYYSAGGHCFYASADNGKKALAINEGKVGVVIDLNLNNNMLAFNDGSSVASSSKTKDSTNVDGIWHDDASNTFHFQSDKPYKTTGDDGNSNLSAANFTASKLVDIKNNIWERLRATLPDGGYWRWEVNPASATDPRFNYVYRSASGEQRYLGFPRLDKNEAVAYRSWVDAQKVNKSGDTMTGKLVIEDTANGTHGQAGIALVNKGGGQGTAVHFDGHFLAGKINKGGMHITDAGSGSAEVAFMTTPAGNTNQDRRHTAMIISNNGALWAKQYGWLHDYFLRKEVIRKDYSRTIRGTNSWDNGTQRNINVVGNMTSYPDGRITQILHVKNFRMPWFAREDYTIGYGGGGDRGFEIALDLWTAMPNKITQLSIVSSRASEGSLSAAFNNEAGEWVYGWNLRKQANNKNRIWVNAARTRGGSDELMDLYITVEGY
ncbi:phage tail protein [Avibacterium avium]|uniref:phage tail protein n=1 Tax=Avibacterium avium TaxID=751 RepID=UPI003BF8F5E6